MGPVNNGMGDVASCNFKLGKNGHFVVSFFISDIQTWILLQHKHKHFQAQNLDFEKKIWGNFDMFIYAAMLLGILYL